MNGGAALVVLHDLAMAARFERVLVLDAGTLVGDGAPLEVLTPQRLRDTWGVEGRLVRGEARRAWCWRCSGAGEERRGENLPGRWTRHAVPNRPSAGGTATNPMGDTVGWTPPSIGPRRLFR
jgi:hypothetical protein